MDVSVDQFVSDVDANLILQSHPVEMLRLRGLNVDQTIYVIII